ncbi:hypothetical protein TSUD_379760 [Trifolium subterraneum]|uniref:Uncharacterized protein n=1 Tax=Trifolium subterraneum TaxID=3900 RepID=A0A2Z6MBA1_TRISU|nr:hypothetical protein TSUD_379760 [Trifolium subterraneum]
MLQKHAHQRKKKHTLTELSLNSRSPPPRTAESPIKPLTLTLNRNIYLSDSQSPSRFHPQSQFFSELLN